MIIPSDFDKKEAKPPSTSHSWIFRPTYDNDHLLINGDVKEREENQNFLENPDVCDIILHLLLVFMYSIKNKIEGTPILKLAMVRRL